jgi:hypothetical protein
VKSVAATLEAITPGSLNARPSQAARTKDGAVVQALLDMRSDVSADGRAKAGCGARTYLQRLFRSLHHGIDESAGLTPPQGGVVAAMA